VNKGNIEALKLLLSETRSLFHHMKLLAEDSYQEETMSGGAMGILRDLAWLGPQSESNLTRLRPLSRIHIEEMVAPLINGGYIQPTPAMEKDILPVIELTGKGRRFIQSSDKREMDILAAISLSIPREEMLTALDVLRAIRKSFDVGAGKKTGEAGARAGQNVAG